MVPDRFVYEVRDGVPAPTLESARMELERERDELRTRVQELEAGRNLTLDTAFQESETRAATGIARDAAQARVVALETALREAQTELLAPRQAAMYGADAAGRYQIVNAKRERALAIVEAALRLSRPTQER